MFGLSQAVRSVRNVVRDGFPQASGRKSSRRGRLTVSIESLETRRLMVSDISFDPSPDEQEMLEHLNRMRMNPQGELEVMFISTDPMDPNFMVSTDTDINDAMDFFNVDRAELLSQWSSLTSVGPLAWADGLYQGATAHNERMILQDMQEHVLPADANLDLLQEDGLSTRLGNAGYNWNSSFSVGENIYAYATSVFYGHAGFAVDWGVTATGIQTPPGHRNNMMSSVFQEVGISVLFEDNPTTEVGEFVITQDFGRRDTYGNARVLGVIYTEAFGNTRYDAGEGEAGVTVTFSDGSTTYTTDTLFAGGYQIALPAGTYSITATGRNITGTIDMGSIVVGTDNVKVDAETTTATYLPEGGIVSGTVWGDADENGILGAGEVGLSTWTVYLDANGNSMLDEGELSLNTGSTGMFTFNAVPAASYTLRYQGQDRFRNTMASDFYAITVENGGETTGQNFGLFEYIQLVGNTATVYGTNGDDIISWVASPTSHGVTVNGVSSTLDASQITTLTFQGRGGSDQTNWTGSQANDTAVVRVGTVTMTSSDYSASGSSFETVYVDGGDGANTRVNMYDSAADDFYVGRDTYARLYGTGFWHEVTNFDKVYGYATAGGTDRANLYDGLTDDLFFGQHNYSVLRGPNYEFYNYAQGWDKVFAYATAGGTDQAHMYDGVGNDIYYGQPTYSVLRGPNLEFYNYAQGFENVQAYANNGGSDTANLYDSAANDLMFGYATYAYLRGPNSEFWNQANSFEVVQGYASNGGTDYAYLHDAATDDIFQAYSTYAVLRGPNSEFFNQANSFDRVYGRSQNGGDDYAYLYDSAADDRFFGFPEYAIMRAANSVYYNHANGFTRVYAYANNGGTDYAYLYDSSGNDRFFGLHDYSVMRGAAYEFYNYVAGFDAVRATSSNGGTDFAYFYDSPATDHLYGRSNYAQVTATGRDQKATGFGKVIANSDDGGGDTKDLSDLDYVFIGYGDWA